MLIILTLTHLVLLIDRYIVKYGIDNSDILLGPLTTEYRGSFFFKSAEKLSNHGRRKGFATVMPISIKVENKNVLFLLKESLL